MTMQELMSAVEAAGQATAQTQRAQLPRDYVAQHPELFKSLDSFNWFVRHHRTELAEAGALIRPTGRMLVVPGAFTNAVMAIGARRAKQAA
jgi:hypothetical protein